MSRLSQQEEKELLDFAEKHSIPVATALNAKTSIPWDHPLLVGVPGNYSRECANKIVCQSDLIFFIGSHTGGQVTHDWRVPPMGVDVIQLDINPSELGRSYPIKLGMQGDAKASLRKKSSSKDENYFQSCCYIWTKMLLKRERRLFGRRPPQRTMMAYACVYEDTFLWIHPINNWNKNI